MSQDKPVIVQRYAVEIVAERDFPIIQCTVKIFQPSFETSFFLPKRFPLSVQRPSWMNSDVFEKCFEIFEALLSSSVIRSRLRRVVEIGSVNLSFFDLSIEELCFLERMLTR